MKPSQIIALSAHRLGMNYSSALKLMEQALQEPASQLIQHNDTLMYVQMIGRSTAKIFFINVDNSSNFIESIHYFASLLKRKNIDVIYMNSQNRDVIKELKMAGINLIPSNNKQYSLMAIL